jgi:phage N-6-adenine-methyltransferase
MGNPTLQGLSDRDVWETPEWVYSGIADHIGGFDCDPCPGRGTTIGTWNWWLSLGIDGLSAPWFGDVWVNPPFSHKSEWIQQVITHHNSNDDVDRIFLLTPDSTDVKSWFHGKIVEHATYIWFSKGRVKFINPDTHEPAGSPSFGTAISVFGEIPASLCEWFHANGWLAETATTDQPARTYTVTD